MSREADEITCLRVEWRRTGFHKSSSICSKCSTSAQDEQTRSKSWEDVTSRLTTCVKTPYSWHQSHRPVCIAQFSVPLLIWWQPLCCSSQTILRFDQAWKGDRRDNQQVSLGDSFLPSWLIYLSPKASLTELLWGSIKRLKAESADAERYLMKNSRRNKSITGLLVDRSSPL
jgi:hypothetical protein